jgi:hypothetical protein
MPALTGIPIAALFAMARQISRREKIDEYRHATSETENRRNAEHEGQAREVGLERMRSISSAQLMSQITGGGLPPGIVVPRGAGVPRPFVTPFVPQLVASPGAWRK